MFLKTNYQNRPSNSGWSSRYLSGQSIFLLPASSFAFISFVRHFLVNYKSFSQFRALLRSIVIVALKGVYKQTFWFLPLVYVQRQFSCCRLIYILNNFFLFVCNALIPSVCKFFSVNWISLNLQLCNSIGWSLSLYILSTSISFPFISSAAISLVDLFRLCIFQRQLDFLQFAALCNSIGWSLSFVYFLTSVGFSFVSCRACNSIGHPLSLVYWFMFYLQLCNSIGWSLSFVYF